MCIFLNKIQYVICFIAIHLRCSELQIHFLNINGTNSQHFFAVALVFQKVCIFVHIDNCFGYRVFRTLLSYFSSTRTAALIGIYRIRFGIIKDIMSSLSSGSSVSNSIWGLICKKVLGRNYRTLRAKLCQKWKNNSHTIHELVKRIVNNDPANISKCALCSSTVSCNH